MRFILTDNAIANLESLRYQYQYERKVNLDEKPSLIGLPTLFGGINVLERKDQISFLEKMYVILKSHLLKEEEIKTSEQFHEHISASRVMIAVCLYVQSQIINSKRHSVLYRLIEDNLGIDSENFLDDEDKETCFLTANRVINSSKIDLEKANCSLENEGLKPISEKEWKTFADFLDKKTEPLKPLPLESDYPITAITGPFFRMGLMYSGATAGMLLGDTISNASFVMGSKTKVTALIGTTLIVLGQAGPTGIAIFAPVVAGKLISAFCSISLAHVLGSTMGLVGQGIGTVVGIPLDVGCKLIKIMCGLIGSYCQKLPESPDVTGYRIADGMLVINGIALQILPENKIPENYVKQVIEITDDGKMYIDGILTTPPLSGIQLPKTIIEELKEHSKQKEEEVSIEESFLAHQC